MDNYAQILTIAIPVFLVLIIIEWGVSRYKKMKVMRNFDTVSSLSSGVSNIIKDVLGLAVIIVSYEWMVDHIAIGSIETGWLLYLLAFIGLDFAGYWGHRLEHEINILWNRHIIHHSSEEFNLACALRQNVSAIFGIFFFMLIPLAIIGVPAKVVAIVAPLHLFAQFWYHTRLIDKLGILEYILVTPSHHRVHHAINDEYIDKNFSQVFIIWDRLFGTYQDELADVPAVYGVKKQSLTWNPFIINYQHFWQLLQDAWLTRKWSDKLRVFYMPTGWRPADRMQLAPIEYTRDPYTQKKYDTPASTFFNVWIWLELLSTITLALILFHNLGDLNLLTIVLYGAAMMMSIFAYTSTMDRSKLAIPASLISLILVLILCYLMNGWVLVGAVGAMVVVIYKVVSLGLTWYFLNREPLVAGAGLEVA